MSNYLYNTHFGLYRITTGGGFFKLRFVITDMQRDLSQIDKFVFINVLLMRFCLKLDELCMNKSNLG